MSVMECATVNAVTTGMSARKRRNGITRHPRNSRVVDPVQDVEEPQLDESQGGLVPSRIEPDQARITGVLEGANNATGRQEPKDGDHSQRQPPEPEVDRKVGLIRLNRVLEQHVEHPLLPIEFRVVWQALAHDVRQGVFVGSKGPVGRQRHPSGDKPLVPEAGLAFVQLHFVTDPQDRRVTEHGVDSR